MKTIIGFLIGLGASLVAFLLLNVALFNAQGLTFIYHG